MMMYLVGGDWNIFPYFSIYWHQSSQLTFIFFRGVAQPPTRTCAEVEVQHGPLDLALKALVSEVSRSGLLKTQRSEVLLLP